MTLRSLWVGALVVACASWAGPARADGDEPYVLPDFMSETPPLPAALAGSNVWRLDLAEALAIALRQNLGLVVERQNVDIVALQRITAGGAFEPQVTAGVGYNGAVAPPVNANQGSLSQLYASSSENWQFGASQMLESGTTLSVGMTNGRAASTVGNAVAPVDYNTMVSVAVTQPLLRGFSLDLTIPRMALLTAHIASDRERYQLALAATTVVQQTEDAYWTVVQTLYRYDLAAKAEARARDQAALTERQIAAGTLAPSELFGARSTVAQNQLAVLQAQQAIEAAWDQLRGFLNLPRDEWARPILPTEIPKFAPSADSADELLAVALKNRPELAQADLSLQSAALGIRVADNNKLPNVSLSVGAAAVGENSTYGATLDQNAGLSAHSWAVGATVAWTPLNRAANAQAAIARRQAQEVRLNRDLVVQQIWLDVRAAVRGKDSAAHQVIAAAAARKLAEQALEVEQRKFMNGTSKNIDVANLQGQLQAQQLAELGAVLDHRKATQSLLIATGRLLSDRNIDLSAPPPKP